MNSKLIPQKLQSIEAGPAARKFTCEHGEQEVSLLILSLKSKTDNSFRGTGEMHQTRGNATHRKATLTAEEEKRMRPAIESVGENQEAVGAELQRSQESSTRSGILRRSALC